MAQSYTCGVYQSESKADATSVTKGLYFIDDKGGWLFCTLQESQTLRVFRPFYLKFLKKCWLKEAP